MGSYKKPKKQLHHEFLYLNNDTVLNALSAFEAGKVDEIIEKTSEASEGGLGASVAAGPVRGGAGKKKQAGIQEELVRTRTWFSAFDAWHQHLLREDALGTFDEWDLNVRNAVSVGDTIEFVVDVQLSPLHKVLTTFLSYASTAGTANSPFPTTPAEAREAKQSAKLIEQWVTGGSGRRNVLVYVNPDGVQSPRIVARLDQQYILGGLDNAEGRFTVIGQVDALLGEDDKESVIRVVRDVPPTPLEIATIDTALQNFIEPAKTLGVDIAPDDLTFEYPSVLLRPVAIFK